MNAILAAHSAQVHPWAFQTILLAAGAWATLLAVAYLSAPLYRRRPTAPASQSRPAAGDVYEITGVSPFGSAYTIGPEDGPAGDEQ